MELGQLLAGRSVGGQPPAPAVLPAPKPLPPHGPDSTVQVLAVQADGRILVSGSFMHYDGQPRPGLARLLPTGRLDTTFRPAPWGPGVVPKALLGRPDGRVVVQLQRGKQAAAGPELVQLGPDGRPDPGFAPAPSDIRRIVSLVLLPDGKLLMGRDENPQLHPGADITPLLRLLPDGRRDPSFGLANQGRRPGSRAMVIHALEVLPDGSLLVAQEICCRSRAQGRLPLSWEDSTELVRRFPNGSLDASFRAGALGEFTTDGIVRRPDGQLLLLQDQYLRILYLQANGQVARTLSSLPSGTLRTATAMRPDGSLLVAVAPSRADWRHYRYRHFWRNFWHKPRSIHSFRVVVPFPRRVPWAGRAPGRTPAAAHARPLDAAANFGPYTWLRNRLRVWARSRHSRYAERHWLQLLHPDGSPDQHFLPSHHRLQGQVLALALQPDGKVLVGGDFAGGKGLAPYLLRLNADGSLDKTFG